MVWFQSDFFESLRVREGVTWGRPLRLFDETDSTNNQALTAASSAMLTGGVFVARSQTHGRGRRGNQWHAQPGDNLTFSVLLRLPVPMERMEGLSLVVGLALRAAVAPRLPAGAAAKVKWPNDVLVGERKLAGILIETRALPTPTAIVGVGINVDQIEFPADAGHPTSLALEGVSAEDRSKEGLLIAFLKELEPRIGTWLKGRIAPFVTELSTYDALIGKRISVDGTAGIARGISNEGELLFESRGTTTLVRTGHVAFIRD